jgi:putative SOS response-associated peptidase YedK
MCGRFGFTAGSKEIGRLFSVRNVPTLPISYNIAPSQQIPGVGHFDGEGRAVRLLHWGLIPAWAKDMKTGYSLINARGDTIEKKPAFRSAFAHRRLIIPASYFYEWQHAEKEKIPYLIRLKGKELFGMAGLWESWTAPTGEVIDSCTIVTTAANAAVAKLHDRMPVILREEDYARWLGEEAADPEVLKALLRPYPDTEMELYPVTRKVGNPRFNSPECMEPVAA